MIRISSPPTTIIIPSSSRRAAEARAMKTIHRHISSCLSFIEGNARWWGCSGVGRAIEFIACTHCRQDIRSSGLRVKWRPVPPVNKSLPPSLPLYIYIYIYIRAPCPGRGYACGKWQHRPGQAAFAGQFIIVPGSMEPGRVGRPRTKGHPVEALEVALEVGPSPPSSPPPPTTIASRS